jgi:tetratricopeptide (TPR) repeat protein
MRRSLPLSLALLAGTVLQGCAHRAHDLSIRPIEPAELMALGSTERLLADGRRYLSDQKFGLAISAFRAAIQTDNRSAAAENGLAVAYASLGRIDLAQRHFELATLYEPGNESYRRNYARLTDMGQPGLAAAIPVMDQATGANSATDSVSVAIDTHDSPETGSTSTTQPMQGPQSATQALISTAPGITFLRTAGVGVPGQSAVASRSTVTAGQSGAQYHVFGVAKQAWGSIVTHTKPLLQQVGLGQVRLYTNSAGQVPLATGIPIREPQKTAQTAYSASKGRAAFASAIERSRRASARPLSLNGDTSCSSEAVNLRPRPQPAVFAIKECSS